MNRPLSPIRHDYKPASRIPAEKQNALPWFAVGLGLPLLGIALFLTISHSPANDASDLDSLASVPESNPLHVVPPETEALMSTPSDDSIEIAEEDLIELPFAGFHPPLELPPEYALSLIHI